MTNFNNSPQEPNTAGNPVPNQGMQPNTQQAPYGQQIPTNGQYQQANQPYTGQPMYNQRANQPYPGAMPNGQQTVPMYQNLGTATGEPRIDQPWYGIPFAIATRRFFKKYAVFSGRASKSEFWWSYLFIFLISFLTNFIDSSMGYNFVTAIWQLAVFIPGMAVFVRRLHDSNKSGWWMALPFSLWILGTIFVQGVAATVNTTDMMALLDSDPEKFFQDPHVQTIEVGIVVYFIAFIIMAVLASLKTKPAGSRFDRYPQQMPQA